MSVVNGVEIVAYNLKLKLEKRPMNVQEIIRTRPREAGKAYRYRFAGVDAESGDKLQLFTNKETAEAAEEELGIKMKTVDPPPKKERKGTKQSCKTVAKKAEEACESAKAKRAAKRVVKKVVEDEEEEAPAPVEKAPAKKAPAKKAPAKKKAAAK